MYLLLTWRHITPWPTAYAFTVPFVSLLTAGASPFVSNGDMTDENGKINDAYQVEVNEGNKYTSTDIDQKVWDFVFDKPTHSCGDHLAISAPLSCRPQRLQSN